ncbi:MAG TPA: IPT/TIG domain-containing protein [Myxococcota bacterium]|nr:IPT/TIG domain-containing protein [Myxococcota bacterium]
MKMKRLSLLLMIPLAASCWFPACSGGSSSGDAGPDADAVDADGGEYADGDGQAGESDAQDGADSGPVELKVQAVLPSRGPIEGGTWANIVGSGFVEGIGDSPFDVRDVTSVSFGDNSAIDIEVIRDDMISVRTPAGVAGPTNVAVENPNGRYLLENAFSYFDTVTAFEVEPADLAACGGTPLSVSGTGFSSDTTILVAGRGCSATSVESSTRVTGLAPPGAPGQADVEVVNRNGRALLFRAVRYHPAPVLDSLLPVAGPTSGATAITAAGLGFEDVTRLFFGGSEAGNVNLLSSTALEASTPPGAAGGVDVIAQGPLEAFTLKGGFVYLEEPQGSLTLLAVAPASGPTDGGQTLTIVGEGFTGGINEVLFGATPASDLAVIDDRRLSLTLPAGQAGPVTVTVKTSSEQTQTVDAFRYFVPLQASSLDPISGPATGGTVFSLQGSGFHDGVEVLFGGVPAGSLALLSDSGISGLAPPGPSGPVDVRVRDDDSEDVLAGAFSYTSDLSLLRVDPDMGAMAGGTYLTCYGQGFAQGMHLYFAGREGTIVEVSSDSILTARTPRGDPGEVNVLITKDSQEFEMQAGFAYFDPTNERGGASGGPLVGSLNVTALDGSYNNYGAPVPGATVLIDQPAISGLTDDRGQVTFSGPALVRALTVTVAKESFEAVTVGGFEAANLSVYLYPNEQEPIQIQPGDLKTADLSGRVFGFKDIPGLPTGPTTGMQARVNLTAWSIYAVPPYGGVPAGQVIENDGDPYQYTLRLGNYSVYALFGSYESGMDTFTPALLGVRRNISLISEDPLPGQDIILSTYLDRSVPVHLENPPLGDSENPASYSAYVSLDLGWDGIIYLSQDQSSGTELVLAGLPSAASGAFIFVGLASINGSYPLSYTFRRQEGEIGDGVTLGPFLGFTEINDPPVDGELKDGRIAWSISGPTPELCEVLIETNELIPNVLWRVILPGDVTEINLPAELLGMLPQGEPLILLIYTANSPRFDFGRFNYGQLSSGRWTDYSINFAVFSAP